MTPFAPVLALMSVLSVSDVYSAGNRAALGRISSRKNRAWNGNHFNPGYRHIPIVNRIVIVIPDLW